jgi:CHAT domain-containing protein/tetratricopeptide (TPR) repeat protein
MLLFVILPVRGQKMQMPKDSLSHHWQQAKTLNQKRAFLDANVHLEHIIQYHLQQTQWHKYFDAYKLYLQNFSQAQAYNTFKIKAQVALKKLGKSNITNNNFKVFVYKNLAHINNLLGDSQKAINYQQKAINLLDGNPKQQGQLYFSISNSYDDIGAYNKALSFAYKALNLFSSQKDSVRVVNIKGNISIIYIHQKRYEKALKIALQILKWRKQYPKQHLSIDLSRQIIGLIYTKKQEYTKALEYFNESLSYRQKQYGSKHPFTASAYLNIASVHKQQGQALLALKSYKKSLEIRKKYKQYIGISNIYNSVAEIKYKQKNYPQALQTYQKALCYNSKTFKDSSNIATTPSGDDYKNVKLFMETLQGKAAVLMAKGDMGSLKVALKSYQLCDELIQKFRQQYVRHQDKLMLAKISAEVYENALVTCYKLKQQEKNKAALYTALAFHFSERNKASILREALQEANARFDLPQQLVEQEQDLKVNLAYYTKQLATAQARKDSTKITRYQNKLFTLNQQHEQLTQNLEKNYPRYYQLKYNTKLASIQQIQQALPTDALLVEYFTTSSQLYAFAVSKTQAKMLALPGGKAFRGIIKKYGRSIKTRKRAGDFAKASYKAYQTLMAPLEPYLANKKQVIVISDGKLLGIPFEPLLSKKAPDMIGQFHGLDFMINRYQFFYHYSANLMVQKMLRKQPTQRNDFLGMAPVFTKNNQSNTRDEDINAKTPKALPYTEKEIDKISEVFKQSGSKSIKSVLHAKATEQSFKTIGQQYKYIHLATHSVTNSAQPELAYIQFEPTPENKDSYNEGRLYANEIYALTLNADLVVLSSCESGSGKIERGEGMMGLNRSFLYAGARHVMYSLWKVKDRPTSEFMIMFYKQLLTGKHSFSKALQLAKQAYIKKHPLKRPHDWAGFLIIGQL